MGNTPADFRKLFLKDFNSLARRKHKYDVFRDFVTMTACSLHNGICMNQEREQEYLKIIHSYEADERELFPRLLAYLIEMLEPEPRDILGELYMELEISSKEKGQFFTPSPVSDLMSALTYGNELKTSQKPFFMLSEPACGAGGMVLSFLKLMIQNGQNPAHKVWVQCIDLDRLAALMCYVQLSLWHVPAEILIGDTLRWEIREVWRTPSHYLGGWSAKIRRDEPAKTKETEWQAEKPAQTDTYIKPEQFDFGF